ncbi:MAG: preprotein translocase subunit SecE [Planctomycetota bacterium]|nr:MAG: preprotein translocase subunit SecE [Planctomycetota bacterium]
MLYRYKPEEGRNARQIAFWLGTAYIAYGCWSLRGTLDRINALRNPVLDGMPSVPLLGGTLNGSFLLALAVFAAGMWGWVSFLASEKVAGHLIETESEMRKVTWPSFKEVVNSSAVVIGAVLALAAVMALSDLILGRVFQFILWNR